MHYLSEYQSFQSKQQMNEAISDHLAEHYYELNTTAREVLNVVSRYAVKFPGVAHLKAATIADIIDKSEKTVRRALNKLQALGIIRKIATMRKITGGKGANIIVVQSSLSNRKQATEPMESKAQATENASEPYSFSKLKNINNINTYSAKPSVNLQPQKLSTPYVQFRDMVGNFVSDQKLTNKLYGIYLAQTKSLQAYETSELLTEGIEAIKVTFQATKRKKLRNLCGYYSGTLKKLLDELYETTMAELRTGTEMASDNMPAWLCGW